jgi:hypothetical protein
MKPSEVIIVLMYTVLFVLCVHSAFGSPGDAYRAHQTSFSADSAAAEPRACRPAAHSSSAVGAGRRRSVAKEEPMDNLRIELIRQALREHGAIRPFAQGKTFNDCFTRRHNKLVFQFVTDDGRGCVVSSPFRRVVLPTASFSATPLSTRNSRTHRR